jgi:hypothetical protein
MDYAVLSFGPSPSCRASLRCSRRESQPGDGPRKAGAWIRMPMLGGPFYGAKQTKYWGCGSWVIRRGGIRYRDGSVRERRDEKGRNLVGTGRQNCTRHWTRCKCRDAPELKRGCFVSTGACPALSLSRVGRHLGCGQHRRSFLALVETTRLCFHVVCLPQCLSYLDRRLRRHLSSSSGGEPTFVSAAGGRVSRHGRSAIHSHGFLHVQAGMPGQSPSCVTTAVPRHSYAESEMCGSETNIIVNDISAAAPTLRPG